MFSFEALINEKGKPLVMGILNITPDSFSDGGEAFNEEAVVKKVKAMCKDGADIIDVGACSTAPGNTIVSEAEEIRRLRSFLPLVVKNSFVPVSVDTFRPGAAQYALSCGARIVNDESGVFNPRIAEVVKESGCGWVFMHTGGKSSKTEAVYSNGVVNDVLSFFGNMKKQAVLFGIKECQLCFDCGIGFGKSRADDISLLSDCDVLSSCYSPLLIGASRKRVIGELTGESEPKNRVDGSVAVAKIVTEDGASVLRVHDIKETVKAVKVI